MVLSADCLDAFKYENLTLIQIASTHNNNELFNAEKETEREKVMLC